MITTILVLASLGLLLTVIGRWLILHEAQECGRKWRLALALLPFADLVFAAAGWKKAKSGVLSCLLGFALILPLVGEVMWERFHPEAAHSGLNAQLSSLFAADWVTAAAKAEKAAVENLYHHKEVKVQQLEVFLTPWYDSLQKRRSEMVTKGGGDVAAFDREAASYQELLGVARKELTELEQLRGKIPAPAKTGATPPRIAKPQGF